MGSFPSVHKTCWTTSHLRKKKTCKERNKIKGKLDPISPPGYYCFMYLLPFISKRFKRCHYFLTSHAPSLWSPWVGMDSRHSLRRLPRWVPQAAPPGPLSGSWWPMTSWVTSFPWLVSSHSCLSFLSPHRQLAPSHPHLMSFLRLSLTTWQCPWL